MIFTYNVYLVYHYYNISYNSDEFLGKIFEYMGIRFSSNPWGWEWDDFSI